MRKGQMTLRLAAFLIFVMIYPPIPGTLADQAQELDNDGGSSAPLKNIAIKHANSDLAVDLVESIGINIVLDRAGNEDLRESCLDRGISYWRIYGVFSESNPDVESPDKHLLSEEGNQPTGRQSNWGFFSPAWEEVRKAKIKAIVEDVKNMKPDGISLDLFRWYMEARVPEHERLMAWESVPPSGLRSQFISYSFDPATLQRFQQETGIKLRSDIKVTEIAAGEILSEHVDEWARWKSELITQTLAEIRNEVKEVNPDIKIMVQTVPWETEEYDGALGEVLGQDIEGLAQHTDIFSPMAYHPLLGRQAVWVQEHTQWLHEKTGRQVWPCIQAREESRMDQDEFTPQKALAGWHSAAASNQEGLVLYGPSEEHKDVIEILSDLH